jgi:hypothetical protein
VQTTQDRRQKSIDASQQMVLRDTIVEPKLIEEPRLIADLPTHHRRTLLITSDQQESSVRDPIKSFFNSIDPEQTKARVLDQPRDLAGLHSGS